MTNICHTLHRELTGAPQDILKISGETQRHLSYCAQITTIKLFGLTYLINTTVRYFFWLRRAMKESVETLTVP